jgi:hypothetical protein
VADDETEPVRPEVLTSQVELASLRIKNWLTLFALLCAKIDQRPFVEFARRLDRNGCSKLLGAGREKLETARNESF